MTATRDVVRDRAVGLFTFLREFVQLRSRSVRDLSTYPDVLWLDEIPEDQDSGTVVFSSPPSDDCWVWVDRRLRDAPPAPPLQLAGWVRAGEGRSVPERHDENAEGELFDADRGRATAWESYIGEWEQWADEDERREELGRVYGRLFSMERTLEREGERMELLLAVGVLLWSREYGSVRRHLLVTDARVHLDRDTGRLAIGPAVAGAEVRFEQDMLDLADRLRPESSADLELAASTVADILDPVEVRLLLERCATEFAADGGYSEDMRHPGPSGPAPKVTFAPALIVRPRGERSLIAAYDAIIDELQDGDVSPAVQGLVQPMDDALPESESDASGALSGPLNADVEDHYLPLPANEQQREIVRRLERRRGVVVQGPPGTGKSHTIANLIADLLARGQRILVTSQTAQALEVLSEKLPNEIAELCVSVLGDSRNSQTRLDASVQAILNRRAAFDPARSDAEIRRLTERRKELLGRRAGLYRDAVEVREAEATHVNLAPGYVGVPARVAERLAAEEARFDWLTSDPAPAQSPVSNADALELLELIRTLEPEARARAGAARPSSHILSSPSQFAAWIDDEVAEEKRSARERNEESESLAALQAAEAAAKQRAAAARANVPATPRPPAPIRDRIEALLSELERCLEPLERSEPAWLAAAVTEAMRGRAASRAPQADVAAEIIEPFMAMARQVAGRRLTGVDDRALPPLIAQAEALLDHLAAGGKLTGLLRPPEPVRNARELLEHVRLDGSPPDDLPTLELTLTALRVRDGATRAWRAWTDEPAPLPEDSAAGLSLIESEIALFGEVQALGAAAKALLAAAPEASTWMQIGFATAAARATLQNALEAAAEADRLEERARNEEEASDRASADVARAHVNAPSAERSRSARVDRIRQPRLSFLEGLDMDSPPENAAPAALSLIEAIRASDIAAYRRAHEEILGLERLAAQMARRDALVEAFQASAGSDVLRVLLESSADPVWDERLAALEQALAWRAADLALARLADPHGRRVLEAELENVAEDLRKTVTELAAARAWAAAFARMTTHEQQHLASYAETLRRLGKGTGKYAARHRRDAQKHLDGCQTAIPAWVMPLYRVAQTVRPSRDRFDVVIVDEASQAGADALLLFHLAPKIVVVGDDQQISPENVGIDRSDVEELQRRHLQGVELSSQIDADTSLFAQAQIRFGGRIVLQEHFRCMPEIIGFSNDLCYRDLGLPLVPLRQFGADRLPPLRSIFVPDAFREGEGSSQRNEPEAHALVDALVACLGDPDYAGKTMGVISLLGPGQARLLEELIRERVDAATILERQIRVGDAYAFQGDERHVIFLSLVATKEPGRRLTAMTDARSKRRFNVAASRAQDQLWLVHSIKPDDISPECVRHKLLRHVLSPPVGGLAAGPDPDGLDDEVRRNPFESIFEQRVYRRIRARGYHVVPQYEVASYRIDLVVVGEEGMLAVECDGDAFHTAANYEADLARERELVRCGWTFFRIRGSAFFRDPETSLRDLWALLDRQGIRPVGGTGPHPVAAAETAPPPVQPASPSEPRTTAPTPASAVEPAKNPTAEPMVPSPERAITEARTSDAAPPPRVVATAPDPSASPRPPAAVAGPVEDAPSVATARAPAKDAKSWPSATTPIHLSLLGGEQQALTPPPAAEAPRGAQLHSRAVPGAMPEDDENPATLAPATSATSADTGRRPASALAQYAVFDYAAAALRRPFPDPRETTSLLVSQGLEEIIRVEGPIKVPRLFSLYVHAAGRSRVTAPVQRALNREMARLARSKRVLVDDEIGTPGYTQAVVRLADSPLVMLRERGPRRLEEIPRREIAALAIQLRRRHSTLSGEWLKRELLNQLNLVRLTPAAQEYLDTALALPADTEGDDQA